MVKKLGAAVATVMLVLGLGAGAASAHPVGEPGTPSCHGERVSHGSSDHGLTPKDRVAEVNNIITNGPPPGVDEFVDMLRNFFGEEASVKEFHQFVRFHCSAGGGIPG
jgi:hypothetical protein